jgi:acetate kinase
MATRSGDVDPGLVLWLLNHVDTDELSDALEHHSGLAGLAGGSGDLRDIVDSDAPAAELAWAVYVHRLRREIAAMAAAMNGLDILTFTGGVGEHQPAVRTAAADGLAFLGIGIAAEANAANDLDITAEGAAVRTLVIPAREDIEIAHQVRTLS